MILRNSRYVALQHVFEQKSVKPEQICKGVEILCGGTILLIGKKHPPDQWKSHTQVYYDTSNATMDAQDPLLSYKLPHTDIGFAIQDYPF